jgi:N-acetyl-gamma-glutamyl-phosphate reductase
MVATTSALSLFLAIAGTTSAFSPTYTRTASNRFDSALDAKKKIFIDGEAGTTGLQVRDRLAGRDDLEIISISDELRKDVGERKRLINEADCVILCLPDDASKEAASMVENDRTVVIDASTAFRVDDDWTYGFPELSKAQKDALQTSKRISNPGCYPTGFIALIRPLVDAGIVPADTPLTVNAISGYSGGGKGLIGIYEGDDHEPWGAYGYSMNHKHLPEMAKYTGLNKKPIFQPAVATFAQGMVVSVPIHYSLLKDGVTGKDVHDALSKHYEGSTFVKVMPLGEDGAKEAGLLERGAFLRPDTLADTNNLELFVFYNDEEERMVLCARLDNLGKGASGAAVQNLNLSLGLDEASGL